MGERKHNLLGAKSAAADLALDGQLIDVPEEAVDWRKVVKETQAAGAALAAQDTIEESTLAALWEQAEGPFTALRPEPVGADCELARVDPDETEQLELFAVA